MRPYPEGLHIGIMTGKEMESGKRGPSVDITRSMIGTLLRTPFSVIERSLVQLYDAYV